MGDVADNAEPVPPLASAVGGAAGEAGSVYRATVGALVVVHGLRGERVGWLPFEAPPFSVAAETAVPVDDLGVETTAGDHAYIQVKASCDLGGEFRDTVDQWCATARAGLVGPGVVVALAVGRPSGPLVELGRALDERRAGTTPSADRQSRLAELRRMLAERLSGDEAVEHVLDAAHVVVLPEEPSAREGAAWLDSGVVNPGLGEAAFRALREGVRDLAARRGSSALDDWRRWLREAHVPSVADPLGTVAARAQAKDEALAAYRASLATERDVLTLHDIGAGIEPMLRPGLARGLQVHVAGGGGDRAKERSLLDVARREGRMLLIGQGGSGKTLALRQVAADWAAHPLAPLPLVVPVRKLVTLYDDGRTARLMLNELVAIALPGADAMLREAAEAAVRGGHATILLDGLDEGRTHRNRLVTHMQQLVADLPRDVGLVVSSRHSSADVAERLGLPRYELAVPLGLDETLEALIQHVARRVPEPQRDTWVRERLDYMARSRDNDPAVWSVPLLATLTVLLLTERAPADIPASRARLLDEVVRASVQRWDANRPDTRIPGLGDESPGALFDTYADIAMVAASGGDCAAARDAVTARLMNYWGRARGTAEAASAAIIDHWDATAGVFTTNVPGGTLTPRTRLFAEIGEARYRVRDDGAAAEWVANAVGDAERHETVRLAAGLSAAAARRLVTLAVESREPLLLDLARVALTEGAEPGADLVEELVGAELERLDGTSHEAPVTAHDDDRFRWHFGPRPSQAAAFAAKVAPLPMTQAQRERFRASVERLPATQAAIVLALNADANGDPAATDLVEAAIIALAADGEDEPERQGYAGDEEVIHAALRLLLPERPDIATAVAQAAHRSTVRLVMRTEAELERHGYTEALAAGRRTVRWPETTVRAARFLELARDEPFDSIAAGFPVRIEPLSPAQGWHLDEAAALTLLLRVRDETPGHLAGAVERSRETVVAVARAVAEAGRLDMGVVRAQIESLRSETERAEWQLLYTSAARFPKPALRPGPEHLETAFDAMRTGNPWLARVALSLYLDAPSLSSEHMERLRTALPQLAPVARRAAAIALTVHAPQIPLPTEDAIVRAGQAAVVAHRAVESRDYGRMPAILRDPDLLVRQDAADQLEGVPPGPDREVLDEALAEPAVRWTCRWCGNPNELSEQGCGRCGLAPPSPSLTPRAGRRS